MASGLLPPLLQQATSQDTGGSGYRRAAATAAKQKSRPLSSQICLQIWIMVTTTNVTHVHYKCLIALKRKSLHLIGAVMIARAKNDVY